MNQVSFNEVVGVLQHKTFSTLICAEGAANLNGQKLIARACKAAIDLKLEGFKVNTQVTLNT